MMAVSNPAVPNIHIASVARTPASTRSSIPAGTSARLQIFMFIVLAHWGEHLVQAYQIYVMGWPRPKANGILGLVVSLADSSPKPCTTATRWSC